MRIFSIIFLLTFFIYAKQDSLFIKSIDSLSIIDSINTILDEKTKLFTSYELRSFNLDIEEDYRKLLRVLTI